MPATPTLLIIADDLTGALDASVPFCGAGGRVVVAVKPAALAQALASGADVVALSTRTRELPAAQACAVVKSVVLMAGSTPLFKKVDSRLKGNVSAELGAMPQQPLLVAPALPEFGRVVRGGCVSGFGVEGVIDIAARLGPSRERALIPDTLSTADMDAAVQAAGSRLPVGARGLAAALARRMGVRASAPAPLVGQTAMVIGSADPITLSQVQRLDSAAADILAAPSGLFAGQWCGAGHVVLQAAEGPPCSREAVAARLAQSFKPLAKRCHNLLLSGGATAEAVLDELGVETLALEGEYLPGVPVASAKGWRILSKSGGFGQPNTLAQLLASRE